MGNIGNDLARSFLDLKIEILRWRASELFRKYAPDQPRVPAGVREGGQWTRVAAGSNNGIMNTWDEMRRPQCEAQLESDYFQCRMMPKNPFCEDQAISRWTACMKGHPIPPLFHVM